MAQPPDIRRRPGTGTCMLNGSIANLGARTSLDAGAVVVVAPSWAVTVRVGRKGLRPVYLLAGLNP